MNAGDVLRLLAGNAHVMGVLDAGPCVVQHVSRRVVDGPDERLDGCPCARNVHQLDDADSTARLRELGGGQYVSSPNHTLGDLVRDVIGHELRG